MGLSFFDAQHLDVEGGGDVCDGCMWGDLCDVIGAIGAIYAHENNLSCTGRGGGPVCMVSFSAHAFLSGHVGCVVQVIGDS